MSFNSQSFSSVETLLLWMSLLSSPTTHSKMIKLIVHSRNFKALIISEPLGRRWNKSEGAQEEWTQIHNKEVMPEHPRSLLQWNDWPHRGKKENGYCLLTLALTQSPQRSWWRMDGWQDCDVNQKLSGWQGPEGSDWAHETQLEVSI